MALAPSSRLLPGQFQPPSSSPTGTSSAMRRCSLISTRSKVLEIADRLCLEVEGQRVSRTEGSADDSLTGGNASAEGPEGEDKGPENTAIAGVDVVMGHHLQGSSCTKDAYKRMKDNMKSIRGKLEEPRPERVKPFVTVAAEQIQHILANFKNDQFLIGENLNPDGMDDLGFREDGTTTCVILCKDGSETEKCQQVWRFGSITCHRNWLLLFIHTPGPGQMGLMLS